MPVKRQSRCFIGDTSTRACASISVTGMKHLLQSQEVTWPWLAWSCVALVGIIGPGLAMLQLSASPSHPPLAQAGGVILAIALMGAGMIAASASGRLSVGIILAIACGVSLAAFGLALEVEAFSAPLSIGVVLLIASLSFAARGALFARSALGKGWWIAAFVVAGEAAIILTAMAEPDALPDWLLALLPAQWASMAIQTVLSGYGPFAASSALFALAGTAAATLFVVRLWPRRWTYVIMFSVWLGLSALVYHHPGPSLPSDNARGLELSQPIPFRTNSSA